MHIYKYVITYYGIINIAECKHNLSEESSSASASRRTTRDSFFHDLDTSSSDDDEETARGGGGQDLPQFAANPYVRLPAPSILNLQKQQSSYKGNFINALKGLYVKF